MLLIGISASALSIYAFVVVLPPAIQGIDSTAWYLSTFQVPRVPQEIASAANELRVTADSMDSSARSVNDAANVISRQVSEGTQNVRTMSVAMANGANTLDRAAADVDNGATKVRGMVNDISNVNSKVQGVSSSIQQLPSSICLVVCVDLPYVPEVKSSVQGVAEVTADAANAANGIVDTAGKLSNDSRDVATQVRSIGYAAGKMADNVDKIGTSTATTMHQVASDTSRIASSARSFANNVDAINTKLQTSSMEIENQVHYTGQSLYSFKGVFTFGLLAIMAASIASLLGGIALLSVANALNNSNSTTFAMSNDINENAPRRTPIGV